jgi:hypothetical protein
MTNRLVSLALGCAQCVDGRSHRVLRHRHHSELRPPAPALPAPPSTPSIIVAAAAARIGGASSWRHFLRSAIASSKARQSSQPRRCPRTSRRRRARRRGPSCADRAWRVLSQGIGQLTVRPATKAPRPHRGGVSGCRRLHKGEVSINTRRTDGTKASTTRRSNWLSAPRRSSSSALP